MKIIIAILVLFFTSNQVLAYQIKHSISDIEKKLKKEIYFDNCKSVFRVTNPGYMIDREDTYKMSVLIKHNPQNFDINEIIFLDDSRSLKDGIDYSKEEKAKAIFDEFVYQLTMRCGMSYPVSIELYNKYNISEYIFDYELNRNHEMDFQIRLTDKDAEYIFENKNKIASSKKEIKRLEIYENFPHNWTLFGTKLYDKIENLQTIGKFKIYEIKENEKKNDFEFQCVSARTLDDKPLIIDSLTDNRGCIKGNNIDLGLNRYVYGSTSDHHYLIRPDNNNESYSIFIVRYSPLEKRILSITAKTKVTFENDDNCIDIGNQVLDELYEYLISKTNNYLINKKIVGEYLGSHPNRVRVYLSSDQKELYTDEDKINELFAVYGFSCEDDEFSNSHFYVWLTDVFRNLKFEKELQMIEENEKILNEKKLGKDIKEGIL